LNRSQPIPTQNIPIEPHETLTIELDIDTEEENTIDRQKTNCLSKRYPSSNTESEGRNLLLYLN